MTKNNLKIPLSLLLEMSCLELRELYEELYNMPGISRKKDFYLARVSYRLQELKHGGLRTTTQALLENLVEGESNVKKIDLLSGKIMPSDATIAKNYLQKEEVSHLNRIVSMYLDYAEWQAVRQIPMKMAD